MKALITGITGQDGSYLAEFLLSRGYDVYGTVRHSSSPQTGRIDHILHRLQLLRADLLDQMSLIQLIEEVDPDEVYNLAGPSHPQIGWTHPVACSQIHALGVVRLLEAIRLVKPGIKFFQASSSEIYGHTTDCPQTERTPFYPTSPFGIAKLHAHLTAVSYRHKHGINACCGILFDHESPRKSDEFITRRITGAAARIKLGLQEKLIVNTLDIRRDWGFAGDFVRAFWMMLQNSTPDDYVIATGHTHTLEDFCRCAFKAADLDWQDHVRVEKHRNDDTQSHILQGNVSHARQKLLWESEISFEEMIGMMVESELERHTPPPQWRSEAIPKMQLQENRI